MDAKLPDTAVAEILAGKIAALDPSRLPPAVRAKVRREMNAGFIARWPHLTPAVQFLVHKRGEILTTQTLRDASAGRPPSDYFGLLAAVRMGSNSAS